MHALHLVAHVHAAAALHAALKVDLERGPRVVEVRAELRASRSEEAVAGRAMRGVGGWCRGAGGSLVLGRARESMGGRGGGVGSQRSGAHLVKAALVDDVGLDGVGVGLVAADEVLELTVSVGGARHAVLGVAREEVLQARADLAEDLLRVGDDLHALCDLGLAGGLDLAVDLDAAEAAAAGIVPLEAGMVAEVGDVVARLQGALGAGWERAGGAGTQPSLDMPTAARLVSPLERQRRGRGLPEQAKPTITSSAAARIESSSVTSTFLPLMVTSKWRFASLLARSSGVNLRGRRRARHA